MHLYRVAPVTSRPSANFAVVARARRDVRGELPFGNRADQETHAGVKSCGSPRNRVNDPFFNN